MSNCTALAGHVELGDWVILSGYSGVHQFCKVGAHSFMANNAAVTRDVPPYLLVAGTPAEPKGVNSEGLKRRGFSAGADRQHPQCLPAAVPVRAQARGRDRTTAGACGGPAGTAAIRAIPGGQRTQHRSLMTPAKTLTIGLVAGESSGDNLGAALIRAIRERAPGTRFAGVAGPAMAGRGLRGLGAGGGTRGHGPV